MCNEFIFEKINGVVTLIKCVINDNTKKVIVPDSFEGEPVIAIGDRAFLYQNIVDIVLPDSIEIFNTNAFYFSSNLKEIKLPKNLRIVKQSAFIGCSSLEKITFPIGVEKINSYCFNDCTSLKAVFAENENAVLGKNALADIFGRSIIEIEEVSFHLIKSLDLINQTNFIIKFINDWNNVEECKKTVILSLIKKKVLKDNLFLSNNVDVISFLLSNNIKPNLEATDKYLEYYLKTDDTIITAILLEFKNRNFLKEKIEEIKERKELVEIGLVDMNYTEFRKLWVCSKKDNKIRISGYKGKESEVTIPFEIQGIPITMIASGKSAYYNSIKILNIEADIETIGDDSFVYSSLTKINLPNTLTTIGNNAFYHSEYLNEIILPDNLTTINNRAFYSCSNLKSIIIPKNVTTLGKEAFKYCEEITKAEILANINTISEKTFAFCFDLKEIILPDTIECIKKHAFQSCTSLEEITIPASVKSIENAAFLDCVNLKKVNFLGDIPKLSNNTFQNTPYNKSM